MILKANIVKEKSCLFLTDLLFTASLKTLYFLFVFSQANGSLFETQVAIMDGHYSSFSSFSSFHCENNN